MTAGRTNHTRFAQAVQASVELVSQPVVMLNEEPAQVTGKLTLGRDGAWCLQFDNEVTLLPGDTFRFTLESMP